MCRNRLCKRFRLTQAVTFADGTLILNLEEGDYLNCQQYCIVVADTIPAGVIAGSPVVVTIGDGAVQYPLVDRCGTQVTERIIGSRRIYKTVVRTTATGGSFQLLDYKVCDPVVLDSIDGADPATGGGGGA